MNDSTKNQGVKRSINPLILAVGAVVLFGIGAIVGVLGSNAIVAGDGEASEEISAPTLDPNVTPTPGYAQLQATIEALNLQVADRQSGMMESAAEATEATPEATAESSTEATAGERALFRIDETQSEAHFKIDETLAGNRITVDGVTDQVAGDIVVDFGNPGSSQVGTIRINVRTLATDSSFRNDAIRGRILESARDEYEFSEFVPTNLSGLPDSVAAGDTLEFQITGDLTVKDVTQSVTFDATVTITDENTLTGLATATVLYSDFGLTINAPPSVADIADEVILEIDFVATRVNE